MQPSTRIVPLAMLLVFSLVMFAPFHSPPTEGPPIAASFIEAPTLLSDAAVATLEQEAFDSQMLARSATPIATFIQPMSSKATAWIDLAASDLGTRT